MIVWLVFLLMIFVFMAIDLGIFNKDAHVISYKEATKWTALWTSLGLLFSLVIYQVYQHNWLNLESMSKSSLLDCQSEA